jgi:DNA mismatch endonuclease, patch repair protein
MEHRAVADRPAVGARPVRPVPRRAARPRIDERRPRAYTPLPTSRRALAELPLVATDRRNPHPTSLATRVAMVGNVGKGTRPELALRQLLGAAGARGYRLNARIEGIRPDLVWTRWHVAVFVHGCFWHRCPVCRHPLPKSNRAFWAAKFRRNRGRDRTKRRQLERAGWRVVEVWEHEIGNKGVRVVARILSVLASTS